MIEWQNASYFKMSFIQIGWNLVYYSSFPVVDYLGADTETELIYDGDNISFTYKNKEYKYINGEKLTEEKASMLYSKFKAKFCRKNIFVHAYAYMLSDGENFALFQCVEDFLTACAMFKAKTVFWYNARFDYAIFDYYFLTHNEWHLADEKIQAMKDEGIKRKHLDAYNYQSLDGDFGARYKMKIWYPCKNHNSKEVVRSFEFIDVCNIFGGGLKANLESFKIKDKNGNDVRKLEMDYVDYDFERDLQYMINDTKGLALLTFEIDKTIKEISGGLSLLNGDYITAGGLAKKCMLRHFFGFYKHNLNVKYLHKCFPLTVDEDKYARDHYLYQGGKCFINPKYVNVPVENIYKYDVNSMYPNQMRNMTYPIGIPKKIEDPNYILKKNKIYIISFSNAIGYLKQNKVPIWYDKLTSEYVSYFNEEEEHLMYIEEFNEYKKWYKMKYNFNYYLEFDAVYPKGAKTYVDLFYNIKKKEKGVKRNGAKLFLNSAYGKWSQRVEIQKCKYVLSEDGYCCMERGEIEIDEKSMMSIYVGARITSLARVDLVQYIDKICKHNPAKYFLYCDTDSVHALLPYNKCSDTELGMMKCEGIYEHALYLAPKTYLLYNNNEYEVHSKGINTSIIENELEGKTWKQALKIFKINKKFKCLSALNCKGGKALIKIEKYLVRDDKEKIAEDELIAEGDII